MERVPLPADLALTGQVLAAMGFRTYSVKSLDGNDVTLVAEKLSPGRELLMLKVPDKGDATLYWSSAIGRLVGCCRRKDVLRVADLVDLGPVVSEPDLLQNLLLATVPEGDQHEETKQKVTAFLSACLTQKPAPEPFSGLPVAPPETGMWSLYRRHPSRRHWDALRQGALSPSYRRWSEILAPELVLLLRDISWSLCLGVEGDSLWNLLNQRGFHRQDVGRECDFLMLRSGYFPPVDLIEAVGVLERMGLVYRWYHHDGRMVLDLPVTPPLPDTRLVLHEGDPRLLVLHKEKVVKGWVCGEVMPGLPLEVKEGDETIQVTALYQRGDLIVTARQSPGFFSTNRHGACYHGSQ